MFSRLTFPSASRLDTVAMGEPVTWLRPCIEECVEAQFQAWKLECRREGIAAKWKVHIGETWVAGDPNADGAGVSQNQGL